MSRYETGTISATVNKMFILLFSVKRSVDYCGNENCSNR